MRADLPGFSSPDTGTEAPLELMAACHVRIQHHGELLKRLDAQLRTRDADEQARGAAQCILRYFDTAMPDHHRDEERDLFPALLETMAGSDPVCIREMIVGLTEEHRDLETQWALMREAVARIAAGETAALDSAAVASFCDLSVHHLRREDDELLPMAARLLGDHEIEAIGQAMRRRRAIPEQPGARA